LSSQIVCGNLTHELKIEGLFSAATTSLMQQETDACDSTVYLLLPTGVWYEPVAKKFKATSTYNR